MRHGFCHVLRIDTALQQATLTIYSFELRDARVVLFRTLLWRLDFYGIDLSKNAAPLLKYAERIFSRPAYIEALTPSEKVMRK